MRRRLLDRWAGFVTTHPRAALAIAALVALPASAAIPGLEVRAGHSGLVDTNTPHHKRFRAFLDRFGSPNVLFLLVEGGDRGIRRQLSDQLAERLPAAARRPKTDAPTGSCRPEGSPRQPGCVRSVFGRIPTDRFSKWALLFLSPADLATLSHALGDPHIGLEQLRGLRTLTDLVRLATGELTRRMQAAAGTSAGSGEEPSKTLAAVTRIFDEIERRVRGQAPAGAPFTADLLAAEEMANSGTPRRGVDSRGYLTSRDGRLNIVMVRPFDDSDEPDVVIPFVQYVRRQAKTLLQKARARCEASACSDGPPRITVTGLPALIADEREALARDLPLTTGFAGFTILLLFVFAFRSIRQGILAMLPLVAALACTLATLRLSGRGLNMLTSAFIPTVLGLGIDFSVHLLARYNEARWRGDESIAAVRAAICGAGPGMLTGAFTSAGAFFALGASRFKAFAELGAITAIGLLFALVAAMTITTALLAWPRARLFQVTPRPRRLPRGQIARWIVRRRAWVTGLAVGLTALSLWQVPGISWSHNYLDLLPPGHGSIAGMRRLAAETDFSGEIAVLRAESLDEVRRLAKALQDKPTVGRVDSLVRYLPDDQRAKRRLLDSLRQRIGEQAPPSAPTSQPEAGSAARPEFDLMRFEGAMQALGDALEDAHFASKRAEHPAAPMLNKISDAVRSLLQTVREVPPSQAQARLARMEETLREQFLQARQLLWQNLNGAPITTAALLRTLPDSLSERLHSRGEYALYVYPAGSVWENDFLARFVADVRSVQPEATGFAVNHWVTSNLVARGFRDASLIAAAVLVVLLMIDFRSLRYALLALAPLAAGLSWTLGAVELLGVEYNFANIIAFPLIVGIGVTSGVHILHRYRQEGAQDVVPVVRHTSVAILLSAATTMAGFGSLALAEHRGAASLGLVLLLGVAACLLAATVFLPALLRQLQSWRRQSRDGGGTR